MTLRPFRAALPYWALVMALGLVLGTLRVLWLVPRVGEVAAVALELPVMLAASWLAARRITLLYGIRAAPEALVMGAAAFVLVLLAELALAWGLSAQVPLAWARSLTTPPGALGLAGQALFALMPLLARRQG